jgi:Fur family ferric uptake transcriptional regulator
MNAQQRRLQKLSLFISQNKMRKTTERFVVLNEICKHSASFSVPDIYNNLKKMHFIITWKTIYNTVELLEKAQLVSAKQLNNKQTKYSVNKIP